MEIQRDDESRNQIIYDATKAAVVSLLRELHKLPNLHELEARWLLWNIVYASVEYAVLFDRGERFTPSDN